MNYRTGIGYDVHQLQEGLPLWLGGIQIPHTKGLVGHSDADVLIHAICDALLGAAGLGDIGQHFPDTDPAYKGADPVALLAHVMEDLRSRGWRVANADVLLIGERPKLGPHREAMRVRIAPVLGLE